MSVGLVALLEGGFYLTNAANPIYGNWIAGVSALVVGGCLAVGFLTPFAAALAGFGSVGVLLAWFPAPNPNLLEAGLSVIFAVIMTVTVGLLGPGAYSVDARLFGPREIYIPRTHRHPE